jgi:hypothetical protein
MGRGEGTNKREPRNKGKNEKCPKLLIKNPIIYLHKMEKLKRKSTAYRGRQKLTLRMPHCSSLPSCITQTYLKDLFIGLSAFLPIHSSVCLPVHPSICGVFLCAGICDSEHVRRSEGQLLGVGSPATKWDVGQNSDR